MANSIIKKDGYSIVYENGWTIKKYIDGTFEAWYPYINSKKTTATGTTFTFYSSPTLEIQLPSFRTIFYCDVNASFTTSYSLCLNWIVGTTLNYRLLADQRIATDTNYRFSAYFCGTWN